LLLVRPDGVPAVVATELKRLKPGRIVVLGGIGAVSAATMTALGTYANGKITRESGTDRFATSVAISVANFAPGVPVVFVANAFNFPDALSGAAAAGKLGAPLLLVRPDGVPAVVATELKRLKPGRIVILGGPAVVSAATMTAARAAALQ
jgi:putative cell wall-binding protein